MAFTAFSPFSSLGVFLSFILLGAILGFVAMVVDALTDDGTEFPDPWRVFWVGPGFVLAAGAGLFFFTGIIAQASSTTGGASSSSWCRYSSTERLILRLGIILSFVSGLLFGFTFGFKS